MTIEDIKPCPFCGGFAELMEFDDLKSYGVVCNDCGAGITSFDAGEEAIYAWNRREYMKWTKDKPTQPGWYWYRTDEGLRVVEVREIDIAELCAWIEEDHQWEAVDSLDGEWSSEPIPMPEGS